MVQRVEAGEVPEEWERFKAFPGIGRSSPDFLAPFKPERRFLLHLPPNKFPLVPLEELDRFPHHQPRTVVDQFPDVVVIFLNL